MHKFEVVIIICMYFRLQLNVIIIPQQVVCFNPLVPELFCLKIEVQTARLK